MWSLITPSTPRSRSSSIVSSSLTAVSAVMDLVTRKWICELVSIEETSTQVQVVFMDALELEGLLELVEARQDQLPTVTFPFDAAVDEPELLPILLAVSDNGPQMRSGSTREFMAMCAIAQHFGRPGTPEVLRAQLADVRRQYNTIRVAAPRSHPWFGQPAKCVQS